MMMRKLIVAALSAASLTLVSVSAFASDDREQMEEECRKAAMEEGVASEDMADYVADCVAEMLAGGEGEGEEE
jgi:hypothetical protein